MNYRLATIWPRTNYAADKTEIIDIDVVDPISRLDIIYETLNGNQAFGDGHPARCISNIELIDGSDRLFSLSGVEAQAADFYHNRHEPPNRITYLNANRGESVFHINFGRFLYDPLYAFTPNQFNNPQLKISIDVNAGGSLSAGGELTVIAHLFDDKTVEPTGFLMHKEVKTAILANDSHEYSDLPTDYPMRKLFIRAQRYGTSPHSQLANIKLSENTDKKVPINHSGVQLIRSLMALTPPYRESILGPGTTVPNYFYCTPTYRPIFSATQWRTNSAALDVATFGGDGGRFTEDQALAGPNWQALVQGWCPHGVIEIPFGMQDDPADWYDVTKLDHLKLDITGGAAVGVGQTCEIFLQQLRNYAG